jgi:hemerythrin superfamily protein
MADANIFERLKADHDSHRALLARIGDAAASEERKALFDAFRIEVTAHAAAEEQTLYATMLANPELRHDAQHSVAEHKEIDDYFEEMEALEIASKEWADKFGEMRRRYTHHIDEEEEDMFPAADEGIADDMIEMIGERFETRKPAEIERAEQGADAGDTRE